MMCLFLHLDFQDVPTHPRARQWWGLELSTILKLEYAHVCGDYLDHSSSDPDLQYKVLTFMIIYKEANRTAVPATVKLRNNVHLRFPVPTIISERKKYISKSAVLNAIVGGTLKWIYTRGVRTDESSHRVLIQLS